MKNTKRIIALILALVMSFSLMATAFAAETDGNTDDRDLSNYTAVYNESGNISYWVDDDGKMIASVSSAGEIVYIADIIATETPHTTNDTATEPETNNGDVTWNFTGANEDLNALEDAALVTKFSDVKSSDWFYNDVINCAKLGIVTGFEDGSFKPDNSVTTIQFLVMLTRSFYNNQVTVAQKMYEGNPNVAWYKPYTSVASSTGISKNLKSVTDTDMNRYEMAVAIYNTLVANNKSASSVEIIQAGAKLKDRTSIPNNYTTYVNGCVAKGIITGMDDGTFSGTKTMTRAQAATVIMRMLKLINNYNPGEADVDIYDDGTDMNQNQSETQMLANGKPATVANVEAILDQLHTQYPSGTPWGALGTKNNHAYAANMSGKDAGTDVRKVVPSKCSLVYGCGGWAAMVSETIFGRTGAPCKEVTDVNKLRPGDIIVKYTNTNGTGTIRHVSIVDKVITINGQTKYSTCDGNINPIDGMDGYVNWERDWSNPQGATLNYKRAYTRYAD